MKVKLIRGTFVGGEYVEPDPKKDGVITVSETDGRLLISGGKALPIDAAQAAAPENRAEDGSGSSTRQR